MRNVNPDGARDFFPGYSQAASRSATVEQLLTHLGSRPGSPKPGRYFFRAVAQSMAITSPLGWSGPSVGAAAAPGTTNW